MGQPIVVPVKSVRVINLSGHANFTEGNFRIARAVGFIEILGERARDRDVVLKIGFSHMQLFPCSTVNEFENKVIGTLKLPGKRFGVYALNAHSPNAYIRFGVDGEGNSLIIGSR